MQKTCVIDTNILIQAPDAIEAFQDNVIVLPIAVIEELDNLKNLEGEKGANARIAKRTLEELRQQGSLTEGVLLNNGGILRIETNFLDIELHKDLPESKMDNRILKVCKGLMEKGESVILVTKDILLRIKAELLGIKAEDYMTEQVPKEKEQYLGRKSVYAEEEFFKDFKKKGIGLDHVYQVDEKGERIEVSFTVNEFVILQADQSNKKTHLGRCDGRNCKNILFPCGWIREGVKQWRIGISENFSDKAKCTI